MVSAAHRCAAEQRLRITALVQGFSNFSKPGVTFTVSYRLAGRKGINEDNFHDNLLKMLLRTGWYLNHFLQQYQFTVKYLTRLLLEYNHSMPITVGVVLGRLDTEIAGSNPAQGGVCQRFYVLCCSVYVEALRRADHTSKEA
jgi:hypothetical protein